MHKPTEVIALFAPAIGAHQRGIVAAYRAGAQAAIELPSESVDWQALSAELEAVSAFGVDQIALRVPQVTKKTFLDWCAQQPVEVHPILSTSPVSGDWQDLAKALKTKNLSFTVQVTSAEQGIEAAALGAERLILKGSESGGFVGSEAAFILAQKWQQAATEQGLKIPYLVQGGIGVNTAAAVVAAGAAGVVLDSQLLLSRELGLAKTALGQWLRSADGSEVSLVGSGTDEACHLFHRRNSEAFKAVSEAAEKSGWSAKLATLIAGSEDCLPLGQDVCLAKSLADTHVTVGGIVTAVQRSITTSLPLAAELGHLAEGSDLAASHGTRYPLLQGPMTRVSDTVDFADAVSSHGGLSFLALAVMRGQEIGQLLSEAKPRLDGMPWGVGMLGFLPQAIRDEQTKEVFKHKPPFAIIAGGRPDQAKQFEDQGITTYLHVPSPGLLENFLKQGARRFIFEGRECGGHVGPRSSFVLWQSACDQILAQIEKKPIKDLHLVFAGGIHDEASSAMVAAMTAPLAARGVKIGLLMGTAYLFTQEAVEGGAIVSKFQEEAVECEKTVVLETGPGHAIRCIDTPYAELFESEKNRLMAEGASHEEIVRHLEGMNIGRLRVASKGVDRKPGSKTRELVEVAEDEQYDQGMYMIGQVAALNDSVLTMAELHQRVTDGGWDFLKAQSERPVAKVLSEPDQEPSDIAIIGMSCYYPDASGLDEYWQNILDKHYAVQEVPKTHWDWRLYFDEDPKAKDRIYSKWGGFIKDIPFDPLKYGITPKSMEVIEPLQLLSLEAVNDALRDAGYQDRPFDRDRTACIVGIGGGAGPKSVSYGFRTCMRLTDFFEDMPISSDEVLEKAKDIIPDWNEDSFPGVLSNICSGRVANRFDFGGSNYAIDAACASSLASLDACVRELESGSADMAIAMGADAVQTPYAYVAFSKTHALSRKGRSRPFDAEGDGIVLSEGVGVVVLKRLADAERDGDKIYSVIKGVGSSSDGKAKGLTAPNATGQARAVNRAYEKANIAPKKVRLIEAHGTGTVVGDQTEATALSTVLRESGADVQSCALGSVKSMIGHSKCAAGIAGVIKTSLALHHKVLPPTLVETPNPNAKFDESALYLNQDTRPWVREGDESRVAGVSAFGFGGTNYHTVLSEYRGGFDGGSEPASGQWPTELFVWRADSRDELKKELSQLVSSLQAVSHAYAFSKLAAAVAAASSKEGAVVLSIVASDPEDLVKKIEKVSERLDSAEWAHPSGIAYQSAAPTEAGRIGMLFPGQGSQYTDMLTDLAIAFPEVRDTLDRAAAHVGDRLQRPLAHYMYPPSAFTDEQRAEQRSSLASTDVAQPALGACGAAMYHLLQQFGLAGDAFAGHSYGEYLAHYAAGTISESDLYEVSLQRGRIVREHATSGSTMIAVKADAAQVKKLIAGQDSVYLANINSPSQTVISLPDTEVDAVKAIFEKAELDCRQIPVSCGFHSPFVEQAGAAFAEQLDGIDFGKAEKPVYSNSRGKKYPAGAARQRTLLKDHLTSSVDFVGMIESMTADGIDTFIEVGPSSVLSQLSREIAPDSLSLATDQKGKHGITQLQTVLGRLIAAGYPVDLDYLYSVRDLSAEKLATVLAAPKVEAKPNQWVVNAVRAKPESAPEPLLLGQPHPSIEADPERMEQIIQTNSKNFAEKKPAKQQGASEGKAQQPLSKTTSNTTKQQMESKPAPAAAPVSTNGNGNGHSNGNGNGNGHAPSVPSLPRPTMIPAAGADQVMMGFQSLMSQFLETQRSVMNAYLGSDVPVANLPAMSLPPLPAPIAPVAIPAPAPVAAAPAPVAPPASNGNHRANGNGNGNGNGAITPDAVQSNGNGNGSTNRVEAFTEAKSNGSSNGNGSSAPKAEKTASTEPTAPAGGADVSIDEIKAHLLSIVGERTGYPEEMLDVDLDLEADLGIDSIKRVEILGELAEFIMPGSASMDGSADDDGGLDLEKLSGLRTLQQILDYLEEFLDSQAVATDGAKKKLSV